MSFDSPTGNNQKKKNINGGVREAEESARFTSRGLRGGGTSSPRSFRAKAKAEKKRISIRGAEGTKF